MLLKEVSGFYCRTTMVALPSTLNVQLYLTSKTQSPKPVIVAGNMAPPKFTSTLSPIYRNLPCRTSSHTSPGKDWARRRPERSSCRLDRGLQSRSWSRCTSRSRSLRTCWRRRDLGRRCRRRTSVRYERNNARTINKAQCSPNIGEPKISSMSRYHNLR